MLSSIFCPIPLMRHIASILRCSDRRITGLRWEGGPLLFPGFCSGTKMPVLSSDGMSPDAATWFNILAIFSLTILGLLLRCSARMSSMPGLLLFLRL